ncbi:MAG: nucleotidyltransferase domain-containing protein [Nanoarchaeota archaeon]
MELIDFLKKHPHARKIFGKRELKIIEKQLWGIVLTQSEKNRLSRDIRKKFDFIKSVNEFSKEFELKKGVIIQDVIKKSIEIIKEDVLFNKIKSIILFGSTVQNERTFRSDVDIAVEFDNIGTKEAMQFKTRILRNVPESVDIQVLNLLPNKIKRSIGQNNKILFEKDGQSDKR